MATVNYDVFADWMINMSCNFKCDYCFLAKDKRRQNPRYKGHHIQKIISGFDKTGLVWMIHMSGGEPFFQPQFTKLCSQLVKKHSISINTNLSSKNVYDFAKKIDPQKVAFIHGSLHFEERERLNLINDFINKYRFLKKYGFKTYLTQVISPSTAEKFDEIFEFFRKKEMIVWPKVLRGDYRQQNYPDDYTQEERKKILKYSQLAQKLEKPDSFPLSPRLDRKFVWGNLSFKGQPCTAGRDFVRIRYNGETIRCHVEATKIGNIFEEKINFFPRTKPCSAEYCFCPYYGLKYAKGKYKVLNSDLKSSQRNWLEEKITRFKKKIFS